MVVRQFRALLVEGPVREIHPFFNQGDTQYVIMLLGIGQHGFRGRVLLCWAPPSQVASAVLVLL